MEQRVKTVVLALIFMGIGELLAEPTDGLTIWSLNHLEQIKNTLSPVDYWTQYLFWYYVASALWYFMLAAIFIICQFKAESVNLYLVASISFGGVLGVIAMLSMGEMDFNQVLILVVVIMIVSIVSIAALDRYNRRRGG